MVVFHSHTEDLDDKDRDTMLKIAKEFIDTNILNFFFLGGEDSLTENLRIKGTVKGVHYKKLY